MLQLEVGNFVLSLPSIAERLDGITCEIQMFSSFLTFSYILCMNGVWDPGVILNDIPLDEKNDVAKNWRRTQVHIIYKNRSRKS